MKPMKKIGQKGSIEIFYFLSNIPSGEILKCKRRRLRKCVEENFKKKIFLYFYFKFKRQKLTLNRFKNFKLVNKARTLPIVKSCKQWKCPGLAR